MADDVAITAGIGTTVATDEIGGRHYQLIKPAFGVADSATLVSSAAGLPVAPQTGLGATPWLVSPGLKLTESYTRAVISCASSGDNSIIAAVAAQFTRIYGIMFTCAGSVNVKLGDTTFYTGAMTFSTGGGLLLLPQGEPYFISSAVNKAFIINLSAAIQVSGVVWYQQGV